MEEEKVSQEMSEIHTSRERNVEHVHQKARATERKPQVAEQIDQLANNITVLENMVESLHSRLSAVSNMAVQGDQPQRPVEPMVPVAQGIHTQADRILNVNERIEAILQSLEV